MSADANASIARRLGQYVYPYRAGAMLTIVAYLCLAGTEWLLPKLISYAFDEDGFTKDAYPLLMVPVVLIGLYLVRGVSSFAGQYLFHWTQTRSVLDFRTALVNSLLRLDAQVYTRIQPGTAVTKVVNDPQQILQLTGDVGIALLRDGLAAIGFVAYLFYLNWQLTLMALIVTPVMALVMKKVNQRMRQMSTRSYDSQLVLVNKVDDITRAWRVVRQFGAADYERQRFTDAALEVRRYNLKAAAASALAQPVSQLVASIGLSLIICLALWQARTDGTGVQHFVTYVAALLLLLSKLRHLSDLASPLTRASVIAKSCLELMDAPKEVDTGTQELPRPALGDIAMEDVRLTYPGATQPALDGLSLAFGAGKTTALVGASGAGKSSIVHLLLGFGRPDAGRILLDGAEIESLTRACLRRQFAVVSQDIVLFDDSVANNIAYAQPRDEAKLEAALRAAHLWDFVQTLPEGVETAVGANGSKLSGGQRQRLAIARAHHVDGIGVANGGQAVGDDDQRLAA
ncbi:MAG: ATP-binding cassette domain-containing protein [Rubrivivax sp.]|nr:MAG: ATP-binding cassette domain-containing protein [Rubrivivax sp.]